MRNAIRTLLIAYLFLVAGCVSYDWRQTEAVNTATVHKIETPLAADFCTKLLGSPKRGCAVRITNTGTGVTKCVHVVLPNDMEAVRHEVGGHCMGQDHD